MSSAGAAGAGGAVGAAGAGGAFCRSDALAMSFNPGVAARMFVAAVDDACCHADGGGGGGAEGRGFVCPSA